MDERANKQRIVLCGSPGAGKKRLLHALAQRMGTSNPTVMSGSATAPAQVSWEALLPGAGAVSVAALHGPAFYYEAAVGELFSAPVDLVIYVLRKSEPDFEQSWRDLELATFSKYSGTARALKRGWNDVPWLFVRHGAESSDARWMTELIPNELQRSVIAVDSVSGYGLDDLAKAIEEMLCALPS
jgi:hypothetical protein